MNHQLGPEHLERLARRRAGAKLGWYIHATLYVLVNVTLFALSSYGVGHRGWSLFPLLSWGLGLTLHGVAVFLLGDLRERLVEHERQRLRHTQTGGNRP